ncbi:putative carbonyl reductase [Xylogone sp. PMI_703]|nr:putative carbonyl reductase [Xylogone sp. PMI_703]
MAFHPDQLPDLSGKVYIVTGGNTGIGYYTVLHLAKHNARAIRTVESIKQIYPAAQVSLLEVDHMALASVVTAAKIVISREAELHGLVNNAGIMATPFEMSKDGFEAEWQTNHLAHWVFTAHLLPLMLETSKKYPAGTVRVVNLTSGGHWFAPKGGINFEDTSLRNRNGSTRYGQSKLANILHAKIINERYGPPSPSAKAGKGQIWTASVHPGLVESQLASQSEGKFNKALLALLEKLGGYIDADRGSYTSLYCIASPDMKPEHSGAYFERIAKANGTSSRNAKNMNLAVKLDSYTESLMKNGGWAP